MNFSDGTPFAVNKKCKHRIMMSCVDTFKPIIPFEKFFVYINPIKVLTEAFQSMIYEGFNGEWFSAV